MPSPVFVALSLSPHKFVKFRGIFFIFRSLSSSAISGSWPWPDPYFRARSFLAPFSLMDLVSATDAMVRLPSNPSPEFHYFGVLSRVLFF